MSKRKKIGLGVLAIAPLLTTVLYFVLFFGFFFSLFREMSESGGQGDQGLEFAKSMFGLVVFIMLTSMLHLAALIYFIVHASRDKELSSDSRVLWIILMVLLSALVFPAYWYVRIWSREEVSEPEYLAERSN
jgi:glucan phosphoethanolaminetransferase (alkaline phosphatase superfamily)